MRTMFKRPQDHPADGIQRPLNGFDQDAYNAYYSDQAAARAYKQGVYSARMKIAEAEVRDGVVWNDGHGLCQTDGTPAWNPMPAGYRGEPITLLYGKRAYKIFINGLSSCRVTNDPISFMANKNDHYIPDDCPVTFTLL